jgi:hypothetical protein
MFNVGVTVCDCDELSIANVLLICQLCTFTLSHLNKVGFKIRYLFVSEFELQATVTPNTTTVIAFFIRGKDIPCIFLEVYHHHQPWNS